MSNRLRIGILLAIAVVFLMAVAVYAADSEFGGKWKGESKPAAPPAGGPAAGGPGAGAAPGGAPPAGGGGGRGGFGGGGGGRGGFGGGAGGFGGFGGVQKIQINLKVNKDGKASGNLTIGDGGQAYDVKDGKVVGNSITFSTTRSGEPVYNYLGELKGDEFTLQRIPQNLDDRTNRITVFVLKKK